MPRRLRVKFPLTNYTLAAEAGTFFALGQTALFNRQGVVQPGSYRINVGTLAQNTTNYIYADKKAAGAFSGNWYSTAQGAWAGINGPDWLDANGEFRGPVASFSGTLGRSPFDINIAGLNGDLVLRGNSGVISAVAIDGQPATAYWVDPTSSNSIALPVNLGSAGRALLIKNTSGTTLTVTWSGTSGTITVNRVAGPWATAYPYIGPSVAPNLLAIEATSQAAITANTQGVAGPYAYYPEYAVDANGIAYLRCRNSDALGERLISWWYATGQMLDAMYFRYLLWIEDDVMPAVTQGGVKLPGISNDNGFGGILNNGEYFSLRMENAAGSPANPGLHGLMTYYYYPNQQSVYGEVTPSDCFLRTNQWNCIEQYVALNTPGQANGVERVWLNGHLVKENTARNWRNSATSKIGNVHFNIYHGGVGAAAGVMHYRVAKIGMSTQYMGVPAELLATPYPAWRQNKTKDQVYTISGSSLQAQVIARSIDFGAGAGQWTGGVWFNIDTYSGVGTSDTAMYGMANGGHADWSKNLVWKLDFSQATPVLSVVEPGSSSTPTVTEAAATQPVHYADGRPASSHTYYCQQWIPSKGIMARIGASAYWGNAHAGREFDAFDIASNQWLPANTYPDISPTFNIVTSIPCVARDPRNDDIYYINVVYARRWKSTEGIYGAWETLALQSPNESYGPMFVDPLRNRLVRLGSGVTYWDIGNRSLGVTGSLARTTATVTGFAGGLFMQEYGALYDPDNDRYLGLFYRQVSQGSAVTEIWEFDPDTFVATRLHSSATNSAVPLVPADGQRPYNKFAYLSAYKCVVYLCQGTADLIFMPTV